MMTDWFGMDNPLFASAILPVAIACALAAPALWCRRTPILRLSAHMAIAAAILLSTVLILGLPQMPPVASGHKVLVLLAAAFVLGLSGESTRVHRRLLILAALLFWAAGLGWMSMRLLGNGQWLPPLVTLVAGSVVILRLGLMADRAEKSITPFLVLIAGAIGLAGLAVIGSSVSIAQTAGVLAASCGGFLLWNWPHARHPISLPLVLGAGLALCLVAAQAALFSQADDTALLLLLPILAVEALLPRLFPSLNRTPSGAVLMFAAFMVVIGGTWVFAYLRSDTGLALY